MFGNKPEAQGGRDDAPAQKLAMPPACPRCDATKAQFNKSIQNYQKAYRKKVEGLKVELRTMRNMNMQLQKQVKQLKKVYRVHVPSVAAGILLGMVAKPVLARLAAAFRHLRGKGRQAEDVPEPDGIATPDALESA